VLSPAAERALLDHAWPGNVRELHHVIERACVLSPIQVLSPQYLFGQAEAPAAASPQDPLSDYLAQQEREYILRSLDACSWQIQETAALLGISRKNLWEKMKRLDIRRDPQD
jgi:DNA-binding NtrC family response regulator